MCDEVRWLQPFELRRKVALECLEPSTIAALALAHSAWTCPCEEILYDHVALVLDFFDQPILQFLRTMITRSQKALLVRTFWIVADDTRSFSQWDMYCDALTQMHGLVNLRVPPSSNGLPHHLLQTVQQGSFKLRFLALPLSAQKSYDLMTRLTCALAPHAGTLRALGHFQEAYFIKKTPPDALQHLSEYGTVFGLISALGVNIYHCLYPTATDVEWARHLRNVRAAVLPDTSSAVTVRHLAITFHSEHYAQIPRLARLIAAAFPDVHSLVLRALVPPSHAGSVPLTDYDTIFACLSPFAARLRELFLECEWTHPIPGLQRAPVITDLDGLELLTRVDTEGCRQLNYAVLPYAKVYYRYGDDPCGWDEEEWDQRQSPVGSSP